MDCSGCGTCCVAPDISALGKKVGEPCRHLSGEQRCRIYEERPAVCRGYRPDEICGMIAAPTLQERVAKYLGLFGLRPD
ncbi:YkgJ family cysteine cluster protein [Geomonas anaerohicana]|uniref:YkgJ family cysteine cluster protein n=1 Tax=Geomonas anaerohicana TaxID=2798583 RepID=A0ABS0YEQ2_9BACT|nr:YkgJ family cysteine cluster protein [Geomonas anaerohicana]MBJ6750776.1 YkgJ family cysteine cluster protein [Geomonas anaerohicana]